MKPVVRILSAAFALFMLDSPPLHAANFTWAGGDLLSGNWSAGSNWAANLAPTNDGTADLFFTGNAGLNPNANLDWSIHALAFSSDAGGFTIQGNPLTLGAGGIVSSDDSVQTIQNEVVLAASQTFRTASTGSFSVNGNINTGGNTLTVDAATDFIVLGGAIAGSGAIASIGVNSLVLTGDASNTYTGGTTVSGSLILGKTGGATAIPGALFIGGGAGYNNVGIGFDEQIADTSAVTINGGASLTLGAGVVETIGALALGNGTVRIGSGSLKVGSVAMTGGAISSTTAGLLILAGNLSATGGGLALSTITGRIDLGGAARTFAIADAADAIELDVPATISNGSIVKTGAGTLRIRGTQTYSSLLAQAGTVNLETPLGTGTSSITVAPAAGTATMDFDANQRLASLTIGNGGIVNLNAGAAAPAPALDAQLLPIFAMERDDLRTDASQSVPEPGALNLLLVGASAFFLRRRLTPRA